MRVAFAILPACLVALVSGCSDDSANPFGPSGGGVASIGGGGGGVPPVGTEPGGGAVNTAGANAGGGAPSTGSGTAPVVTGPGSYALAPPSQCHNSDWIEGCTRGVASSACGGKCDVINACQESSTTKPGSDVGFICPRFMLFSDQMLQAAVDDGNSDFNYAIVGHDVDEQGIDGAGTKSTCCQCYQLVFTHPSIDNEKQCLVNPDDTSNPASAITVPKPLIVQSFNTAATPTTFDVYMAAGGFGANNACAPGQQPAAQSGQYMYTAYPAPPESNGGAVKPVTYYSAECKTSQQWVTSASLGSTACQTRVNNACNTITSDIPGLTEQARRSCNSTNSPDSPYHVNWSVYVMKVECPAHLTEVTGCKLAPQGLPVVDKAATTAAQALANSKFVTKSSKGTMYEITTMEDCCRPSCAATNWISGKGLVTDSQYNAFYTCDVNGQPYLQK